MTRRKPDWPQFLRQTEEIHQLTRKQDNMKTRIRRTVVTAAVTAALTIGAIACGEVIGEQKTGQEKSAPAQSEETPPAQVEEGVAAEEAAPEEATPVLDVKKDVKIKSCKMTDPYDDGIADRYVVVDIAVKNSTDFVADYLYEVEATDVNGDRIELMVGSASKVSPGQTIDTGDSSDGLDEEDVMAFEVPAGIKLDKCQVISVDASPSVE